MKRSKKYKILFAAAEVTPFAKTGGLADVAGSLPKYISALGHDVRIIMPRYKMIDNEMKSIADFPIKMGESDRTCIIKELQLKLDLESDSTFSQNIPVYFAENYYYFGHQGIYGHSNDDERFAFFCKAILEMLPKINFQPDIIHLNDWHTGPVCMLLKERYVSDSFYSNIGTVFTVHNLEYQGNFPSSALKHFDMPDTVFTPEKVEFYGSFSFMKAGLCYADIINTVSMVYAEEVKTPQCGAGLEGLLTKRSDDLYGITNGIDYGVFNPYTDPNIYYKYTASDRSGKKLNKSCLQKEMGLPELDVPIIGLISRLAGQKGLDLVLEAFNQLISNEIQFILLGTGDRYYENAFKTLKKKYPDKLGLHIGFNSALAPKIYAGSDLFLMPSHFEPCGLGQLISLRYGTIPIVRATGGLEETVIDIDSYPDSGNGFSFKEFTSEAMMNAVTRSLKLYNDSPAIWDDLVGRAMNQDNSWNRSAERYVELYDKVHKRYKS